MNTHRLTNEEGKTIDFDSEKYPEFMDRFSSGSCAGLECVTTCPILSDHAHLCSGFLGKVSIVSNIFENLTLEPMEKAYNLLELEEGVEYSCDDFPHCIITVNDYAIYSKGRKGMPQRVTNPLYPRTFRKIKKKKVKKAVELSVSIDTKTGACIAYNCSRSNTGEIVKLTGEYYAEE